MGGGLRPILPRRIVQHEPLYLWQDRRGYRLSDRIWQTGEATRARIDALLEEGIARGRSATQIADDLESFLRPERTFVRTRTPYGTDGSFDARRLARSEITRAHSEAARAAGIANPFTNRAFYHLSLSHKPDPGDPCERFARESEEQGGFPPESVPVPMLDTHPHCLCYITHSSEGREALLTQLSDTMERSIRADRHTFRLTPLATRAFIAWLLWGQIRNDARQASGLKEFDHVS